MRVSLGELAVKFGCELIGDPEVEVSSVSALAEARSGSIAFLANSAYKDQFQSSNKCAQDGYLRPIECDPSLLSCSLGAPPSDLLHFLSVRSAGLETQR